MASFVADAIAIIALVESPKKFRQDLVSETANLILLRILVAKC